ncbi:proline--tRNA ligase, partial [Candidatus Aerophobetes bacterium]
AGKEGFVSAHFAMNAREEKALKKDLGVTVRCIRIEKEEGVCPFSGKPSLARAIYAKAY